MFQVRPFEAKTLSWWHAMRPKLDMNPPYQRRGGLWNRTDKAYLIDSIINGFDIPKLYIADFTYVNTPLNKSRLPYAIIDGRQRLEAIFDFFAGNVTLNSDFQYLEDPTLSLGGLSYKDLQKNYINIAQAFDTFNLSVMSVITDDYSKINELFVRLNRSKPLTGAEIRNAMAGHLPELFRKIASHELFKDRIRFNTARGQDLNIAAKFLLVEFRGRFVDTKKIHIDRFVEEGVSSETDSFDDAAIRVRQVLDRMTDVFISHDPLLANEGPLLVYYWFVRTRTDEELSRVREFLVDFESNRKRVTALQDENISADERLYLTYETHRRNINDNKNMLARFRILEERWRSFYSQKLS